MRKQKRLQCAKKSSIPHLVEPTATLQAAETAACPEVLRGLRKSLLLRIGAGLVPHQAQTGPRQLRQAFFPRQKPGLLLHGRVTFRLQCEPRDESGGVRLRPTNVRPEEPPPLRHTQAVAAEIWTVRTFARTNQQQRADPGQHSQHRLFPPAEVRCAQGAQSGLRRGFRGRKQSQSLDKKEQRLSREIRFEKVTDKGEKTLGIRRCAGVQDDQDDRETCEKHDCHCVLPGGKSLQDWRDDEKVMIQAGRVFGSTTILLYRQIIFATAKTIRMT